MTLNIKNIEEELGWKTQLSTDRKSKEYKLLDKTIIECPNCRLLLLFIIRVKESTKQNIIQVECPVCNEFSFTKMVSGEIYIDNAINIQLVDVETDKIKDCYYTKIKVHKNE